MTLSLLAVAYLIALASLSHAVGSVFTRRVADWRSRLEEGVFAIPLGMGCIGYFLLACGLLRLFRPPLFYGIMGAGAVSLPFTVRRITRNRADPGTNDGPRPSIRTRALVAFLALLGVCVLIAALAPPSEWDALSYHLAAPKVYLDAGRIFYIPYDHHTNLPFTLEMLFTLMLGVGSQGGAKLCHTLCGALMIASVYTAAVRHIGPGERGRRVGLLAALILAGTPMVLWEMTVAYSDLATALFTWLAVYGLLTALLPRPSPVYKVADLVRGGVADDLSCAAWEGAATPHLIVSAILLGFAIGTKFTALAFWGILLIVLTAGLHVTTRSWKASLPTAARWGALSLLVGAPFYIKTWLYTGNPVFPFAYGLFGGRFWSAENAAKYTHLQAGLGGGKTLIDLLMAPWFMTMLPTALPYSEYYTFGLSPLYVASLVALPLVGRRLSLFSRCLFLLVLALYAFWFLSVQQTRYLLPALPAAAIVCAEILVTLYEFGSRLVRAVLAVLVGMTLAWAGFLAVGMAFGGVREFGGHRVLWPAWPVVSGRQSRDDFLSHSFPGFYDAEHWINENTPGDAKVALFDFERGYFLDRPYMWAVPDYAAGLIPYDAYPDADAWLADFKRRGYTTLLLGPHSSDTATDNERWRSLLGEAIRDGKIALAFEKRAPGGSVEVYRIP